MNRTLRKRLAKLEDVGASTEPAEFEGIMEALLASRRERSGRGTMTDEQRAIATAPDFYQRVRAWQVWRARQKLDPEAGQRIAEILKRRPA